MVEAWTTLSLRAQGYELGVSYSSVHAASLGFRLGPPFCLETALGEHVPVLRGFFTTVQEGSLPNSATTK